MRRFRETGVFEAIFDRIFEEAARHGFLEPDVLLFIDAIHVKASANKNKYVKEIVHEQSRKYQEQLDKEINKDRIAHGKKPFEKKVRSDAVDMFGLNMLKRRTTFAIRKKINGFMRRGEKQYEFLLIYRRSMGCGGHLTRVNIVPYSHAIGLHISRFIII